MKILAIGNILVRELKNIKLVCNKDVKNMTTWYELSLMLKMHQTIDKMVKKTN